MKTKEIYICECIVYDPAGEHTNVYEIKRYIEAKNEDEAENKLVEWANSLWGKADVYVTKIY